MLIISLAAKADDNPGNDLVRIEANGYSVSWSVGATRNSEISELEIAPIKEQNESMDGEMILSSAQTNDVESADSLELPELETEGAVSHSSETNVLGTGSLRESAKPTSAEIVSSAELAQIGRPKEEDKKAVRDATLEEKQIASDSVDKLPVDSTDREKLIAEVNEAIEAANQEEITDVIFARSMVEYPDIFGEGTTLRYILSESQIKEELVLDFLGDFQSYSMNMDTAGLKAALQENKSVLLLDDQGETIVTIESPLMYDSKGEFSDNIEVTITQDGDQCVITYTPDTKWLNASERVWPVVIDPTIYTYTGATASNQIDNYVYDGQSSALNSSAQYLYAGWKPVNGVRKEHILYWRVSTLPTISGTMTGATFNIRMLNGTTSMLGEMQLWRVMKTWNSSTITYANRPSGSTYIGSKTALPSGTTKWLSYNVNSAIFDSYTSGTFHGFAMKYAASASDYNCFYSADYSVGNSAYIPYVAVTYSTTNYGKAWSFKQLGGGAPNCFGYALNLSFTPPLAMSYGDSVSTIATRVEAYVRNNLGRQIRRISGPSALIGPNEYRFCLRVCNKSSADYDYHFMVQTNVGTWAQKHGTLKVFVPPHETNPISGNPSSMNWNYPTGTNLAGDPTGWITNYYNSSTIYFASAL